MEPILLKVLTPNRMLFLKGKLSRTPFEAIIEHENELKVLKTNMASQGIVYETEPYVKKVKQEKPKPVVKKEEPKKKPKTEPKSILEKIAATDDEE